jgi:RimJ/RimL family protein N-acetyltransferase
MQSNVVTNPEEFLGSTSRLLADEAKNSLILSLARGMIRSPELFDGARMFTVSDGNSTVASALITPPYNLIISEAATSGALERLVSTVLEEGIAVPGAIGVHPTIGAFVALWQNETGDDARIEMEQGIFSLERVEHISPIDGRPRLATVDDIELVIAWSSAFMEEALPGDPVDRERQAKVVERRLIADAEAGVWLWEKGGTTVSMSGHSGPTGSGIRISGVYTPTTFRGNGYATALVAHQSQWLLDSGYRICTLFTDLSNPTSNAIYRRIGYRQVAESAMYRFRSSHQPPATSQP